MITASYVKGRAQFHEPVTTGLTPGGLYDILTDAVEGKTARFVTMAEELEEKYLHYAALLEKRKLEILSKGWYVLPGDDSEQAQEIADEFQRLVTNRADFYYLILDLLDALSKGFAVIQPIWDISGPIWYPSSYYRPEPQWFQFGPVNLHEIRFVDPYSNEGEAIDPSQFLIHFHKRKSGHPGRGGLARIASVAWMIQAIALKDWAGFVEVFGVPLRIATMKPSHNNAQQIAAMRQVLEDMGSDAAAIIPDEIADLRLEDGRGSGSSTSGANGPHDAIIRYLDECVSKVVQGQTMTTDNGSSRAQATVHQTTGSLYPQADAFGLGVPLNDQLSRRWTTINYGPDAPAPIINLDVEPEEDVTAFLGQVKEAVDMGARVRESDVLGRLGLEPVDNTDPILGAPAPAPAPAAPPAPGVDPNVP